MDTTDSWSLLFLQISALRQYELIRCRHNCLLDFVNFFKFQLCDHGGNIDWAPLLKCGSLIGLLWSCWLFQVSALCNHGVNMDWTGVDTFAPWIFFLSFCFATLAAMWIGQGWRPLLPGFCYFLSPLCNHGGTMNWPGVETTAIWILLFFEVLALQPWRQYELDRGKNHCSLDFFSSFSFKIMAAI